MAILHILHIVHILHIKNAKVLHCFILHFFPVLLASPSQSPAVHVPPEWMTPERPRKRWRILTSTRTGPAPLDRDYRGRRDYRARRGRRDYSARRGCRDYRARRDGRARRD